MLSSINLNGDEARCFSVLHAEEKKLLTLVRVTVQARRRDGLCPGGVCCTLQMLVCSNYCTTDVLLYPLFGSISFQQLPKKKKEDD